jgi:hypothetical protein
MFEGASLHTPLYRSPNLLRPRPRHTLLNIPVLENTERRHLTDPKLLRYIFAFFHVVRVEFDLWRLRQQRLLP